MMIVPDASAGATASASSSIDAVPHGDGERLGVVDLRRAPLNHAPGIVETQVAREQRDERRGEAGDDDADRAARIRLRVSGELRRPPAAAPRRRG